MRERLSRRALAARWVRSAGVLGLGGWATRQGWTAPPALGTGTRPEVTHGVASGEVTESGAVIWSRTDREARLVVEWSTHERFRDLRRVIGPTTGPEADFTAQVALAGLPAGERVFYRVRFEDAQGRAGPPVEGRLQTASRRPAEVHFAWSGDTCGQGYGIDPAFGGLRTYESIRRAEPQFLVHSGDTIYADNPLPAELALPDGRVWRNRVTPEKAKVAETLAEFRGNYRYALLDAQVRAMLAEVPILAQWDDHEVLNNWWPGQRLPEGGPYREREVSTLAARSRQAFLEYFPVHRQPDRRIHRRVSRGPLCELFFLDQRSFRAPNGPNREEQPGPSTAFLGAAQLEWIQRALAGSRAVWKVVCSDMPVGLVIRDGPRLEGWANGDGPPLGRELELAALLRHLQRERVRNVIWLTADVHYAAAHHFDPARARFTDFDPFWEFVSGPLHAGTFGPAELDPTFGPEVRFTTRRPGAAVSGPWTDAQHFGTVRIDPRTRAATVSQFDRQGRRLWSTELEAVA